LREPKDPKGSGKSWLVKDWVPFPELLFTPDRGHGAYMGVFLEGSGVGSHSAPQNPKIFGNSVWVLDNTFGNNV